MIVTWVDRLIPDRAREGETDGDAGDLNLGEGDGVVAVASGAER